MNVNQPAAINTSNITTDAQRDRSRGNVPHHIQPLTRREMLVNGNWVIPYFNNAYRFDKPPLTYWLMAGGYALFGVDEFGARSYAM
ncbi:MAG: hypothetical protein JJ992_14040, partial [Planctomycetes bacterium]|nr:hypothetical protein [Planctomycetota bacterium]